LRRNKGTPRAAARALELFDLPPELAGGTPKITITGGSVHVERHRGLAEYTDSQIAVLAGGGVTRFFGSCLTLAAMSRDELLIKGRLERVEFSRDQRGASRQPKRNIH
jgi:sporulation protein YqfC